MGDLTDEQHERVERLREHYADRAEEDLAALEAGEVDPEKVPLAHKMDAGNYWTLGIFAVYDDDVEGAREAFSCAAAQYAASGRETKELPSHATRFRSLPMTWAKGIFAALLAGDAEAARELARSFWSLREEATVESDPFFEDKHCFGRCLAGVVLGAPAPADLDGLRAVNREKPPADAHYGRALIEFGEGVHENDADRLGRGVRAMLNHHEAALEEDNVVDLIMAPEATALAILARLKDYEIAVENELIPTALVAASSSDTG